jgi:signal transduction histidine kinase/ActR/RegA family two-component response regulator
MDRLSDRAIVGGEHGYSQEFRCRDREGNEHWLLESVSLQQRGPDAWYAVGVVTDITESKMAQAQRDAQREQVAAERTARAEAEAANRAKDEFFAVLSHELRTPMTPVLMTVSSLEYDERLPEDVRSALRMVRRNVELEARLIDDLLDLTRISRGKLEVAWRDLDMHSLLSHAREACIPDADARRLKFELSTAASRCFVRGDATRLQQVLWNLLRNAVKFTPEGGTIRVHTANDADGHLIVEVTDSGIGIEPEVLPRIFDAFEQGGRDMTRRYGGLGLGLAISKALVTLHGGTLTARSEGRGMGATFSVTLPTVETMAVEPASPAARDGDAPALRILLVEDHVDTRKATARLLKSFGHEVATADSVATGLEAAEAGPFDLIISDLGLPDGSGLDLMRQIKNRYGMKGIALSGFGMESDLLNSRAAGFDHHLTKPVPIEQLEATVRQVAAMEVGCVKT